MVASNKPKKPALVITGPTATGKTPTAIETARMLGGEVLCADSMQVYKGLDIGTAKPTADDFAQVPHHLYGFVDPDMRYSVAQYAADARQTARQISDRKKIPILCGGTGQYVSAFADETVFTPAETDLALRQRLCAEVELQGIQHLIDEVASTDADYAATLHPNDRKRVVRAVELLRTTGKTIPQQNVRSVPKKKEFDTYVAVLYTQNRAALYARIDRRVDDMMTRGLLDEARMVYERRETFQTAAQAIGYKEFFGYFAGTTPLERCVDALKQATRNYAKRQLTWFRRMENAVWYNMEEEWPGIIAQQIIRDFNNRRSSS